MLGIRAADMLEDLDEHLNALDQPGLRGAEGPGPGQDRGVRADRTIDPAHLFPIVGDDVTAFGEQFGVDWTRTAGKQAR